MKRFAATGVLLASMVLAAAGASNLLVNASFDTPPADFGTDDAVAQWAGTGWGQWGADFRQRWAAHSGHAGGYFRGWTNGTDWAGVYQDVASTGGIYTFTVWCRREPAFTSLNNFEVKLEWLDSTHTNWVDTTTFAYYQALPADGLWHHLFVTATGTDSRIAYVRPVLAASWNLAGGSLSFDDAQVYEGAYTGATPCLLNPSFEFYTTNDIRGSQWACSGDSYYPLENPWDIVDWAPRTGARGLAFKGWLTNFPSYEVVLSQIVTPGVTGVYTFAGFANREGALVLTNAGMRIDVYDQTMTNLLQSAVTNFVVPGTTNFIEYYVTLDVTNPAAWEVRPSFMAQWDINLGAGGKALRLDDFSFYPGAYTPWAPKGLDYIYFNFTNAGAAQNENVPGLGGVKFLDYHYVSNEPSYVYTLCPPGAILGMQARFYFAGGGGELRRPGAWYTNVVIDAGSAFHEYPAAGSVTLEVWRAGFYPPPGWQNNLWYAPVIKRANDGVDWWLAEELDDPLHPIASGVTFTNSWPTNAQRFWSQIPYDHDSYYYPTGAIDRWSLNLDYAYHGNTNGYSPLTEIVPGFTNVTFLQTDYAHTQTIFWMVTERPANVIDYETLIVQLRVAYPTNPPDQGYMDQWLTMSWVSNVVLDATLNPFHGLPSAGTHTVDLWRVAWPSPLSNGVPDSRLMNVYYSPFMKTQVGSDNFETDYRFLVTHIDGVTNRWGSNNYVNAPQFFGRDAIGHDYLYLHQWSADGFTDGIPNWWWDLYGVAPGDRTAAGDIDNDGYLNIEEYGGDTHPTNGESFFHRMSNLTGQATATLYVNPSSTGRVYDVYWRSNLIPESAPWVSYGLSVTGLGGQIGLTVTNIPISGFYRTGARLP